MRTRLPTASRRPWLPRCTCARRLCPRLPSPKRPGGERVDAPISPQEHDSLDGVPEPSETVRLFGHVAQVEHLATPHRAGKLPHGLVVAGPPAIGKATLACQLAHYLLANPHPASAPGEFAPRDATSPLYRQVASGAHPSVL